MTARLGFAAAALVLVTVLTGCGVFGKQPSATPVTDPSSLGSPAATGAAPSASGSATSAAPKNDLAQGRLSRTFKAGSVTVSATYSTPLPTSRWTPGVAKPLNVAMTAYVNGNREQKIYVSRVAIYANASDSTGDLGAPDPLTDTANILPGYIVTFPDTYDQQFVLPQVDGTATKLTIAIRYELLLYRGGSNPRDYAKQSATDTLQVPLVS